jgi:hypothetical protein
MAGELLPVQPKVKKLEEKRSTFRKNGRKDIEYLVSFEGYDEKQSVWYPAKKVRKCVLIYERTFGITDYIG